MKERIVIVLIAGVLGLLVTTAGFFIYQSTKTITEERKRDEKPIEIGFGDTNGESKDTTILNVTEPPNESLVDKRTIQVKGKTLPDNTIVVSSNQEDVVGVPKSDGDFSITIAIEAGVNKIITRSISPEGEVTIDEKIVTYSTEDF